MSTEGALCNEVALVTGAGRGIGREIALAMASQGAKVVLAARSEDELVAVAGEIEDAGGQALVVRTDLRDEAAVRDAVDRTKETFGPVSVLVNNSGIAGPSAPLHEISLSDWEESFRVNVTGGFLFSRAVLPDMLSAQNGSIIFIGSVTGKRPLVNRTPYAATKMALVGLTRTLAMEVGDRGIRVNLISPGPVAGERLDWVIEQQALAMGMTEDQARAEFSRAAALKRVVKPGEIADVAVFLASDASAAITGEDVNVGAGLAMY